MVSQVIFKIDKKIKEQALEKAQKEGVSLSDVLKLATQDFVKGDLEIKLVRRERLNAATRRSLARALKDIKAGRNLSPAFDNVEDMIKYIESSR